MVVHAYNSSSIKAETGRPEAQGYSEYKLVLLLPFQSIQVQFPAPMSCGSHLLKLQLQEIGFPLLRAPKYTWHSLLTDTHP